MEQINKIELKGNIGSIKVQSVGDKQVARFSLATNYVYKGKDGNPVIETTWHNVVAWPGKGIPDFASLKKGGLVFVTGRLRSRAYTDNDGIERQVMEVMANKIEITDGKEIEEF